MFQWISTADRLPDTNREVLITINYDDDVHMGHYKDGKWFIFKDEYLEVRGDGWIDNELNQKHTHVIAWMKLPQEYILRKRSGEFFTRDEAMFVLTWCYGEHKIFTGFSWIYIIIRNCAWRPGDDSSRQHFCDVLGDSDKHLPILYYEDWI